MSLPRIPIDVLKLSFYDKVRFGLILYFVRLLRLWKYPIKKNGDLAKMKLLDKAYWIFKAETPIKTPPKGSSFEEFFSKQVPPQNLDPALKRERHSLSIAAVGDIISNDYIINSKNKIYQNVSDRIFGKDISMANLECPIVQGLEYLEFKTNRGPKLSLSPDQFEIINGDREKKFTFFSTACNHALDFGKEGIALTIERLNKDKFYYNGISLGDNSPSIISKKNMRLGVISYTFGLNAYEPPDNMPNIVNCLNINDECSKIDFNLLAKKINSCKSNDVDFTILHLHWGLEHESYPMKSQIEVAHKIVELGADLIIGHHPHVIQPVEYYRPMRDKNRVVPIFYSLGNFINPFSAHHLCLSYLANIQLGKGTDHNGKLKTYVTSCDVSTIFQRVDEESCTVTIESYGPGF